MRSEDRVITEAFAYALLIVAVGIGTAWAYHADWFDTSVWWKWILTILFVSFVVVFAAGLVLLVVLPVMSWLERRDERRTRELKDRLGL